MASRPAFPNSEQQPSTLKIIHQECVEIVWRRREARGQGEHWASCVMSHGERMGIVSGGIPENESKKEVKAARCYGNNGGQDVLKCRYNGLLCFSPDTPHEVIMALYSDLHI